MSNGTEASPNLSFAKKPTGGLGLGRLKSSPGDSTSNKPKFQPRRPKAMSFNSAPTQVSSDLEKNKPRENVEAGAIYDLMKGSMGNLVFGDQVWALARSDIEDRGKIGSGVTGEVFRYIHKPTGQVMAVKKMVWMDETEERKRVLMDLNVMSIHKSPHIVKYYGSVIWNNEVWVFMELMTTCLQRLFNKLESPIPEDVVCKMAVSIVKALHYLKTQHKVIHRDVKPSNMLLDRDGSVKLCDFGISGRLVDSQAFTRNAGCASFMAPERINLSAGNGGYDIRADIWSLGISLVQLATGKTPYSENKFKTEFELLTHIVQAPPPLPNEGDFSPQFYDFLSKCLTKEVGTRPQYNDLLEHPLIKEYEEKPVDVGEWLQSIERTVGL